MHRSHVCVYQCVRVCSCSKKDNGQYSILLLLFFATGLTGICAFSLKEETENKTSLVRQEMTYRESIQEELQDLLQWLKDAKNSAERSTDLTPSPAQVQDRIDSINQVRYICKIYNEIVIDTYLASQLSEFLHQLTIRITP